MSTLWQHALFWKSNRTCILCFGTNLTTGPLFWKSNLTSYMPTVPFTCKTDAGGIVIVWSWPYFRTWHMGVRKCETTCLPQALPNPDISNPNLNKKIWGLDTLSSHTFSMSLSFRWGTAAVCLQAGWRILTMDLALAAGYKQSMTHPNGAHSSEWFRSKTALNILTLGVKNTHMQTSPTLILFPSIIRTHL